VTFGAAFEVPTFCALTQLDRVTLNTPTTIKREPLEIRFIVAAITFLLL
jgi:hypothetical protein